MSALLQIAIIAVTLWIGSWLVMIGLASGFRPDCCVTPPSSCPPV